jgi:enediyne biosynthesis protein E4
LYLRGAKANRDAIGSFVRVEAYGKFQVDLVRNGGSYLSHDDPRLHFGLKNCESVDRVVVRWEGGKEQVVMRPALNRYITVQEPF